MNVKRQKIVEPEVETSTNVVKKANTKHVGSRARRFTSGINSFL
jgi:hypothetical protein